MGWDCLVLTNHFLGTTSQVVEKIQDLGTAALYVPADLSIVDDCRQVVSAGVEKFGHIDGLVNAAADTNRGTLEETTVEF